MYVSLFPTSQNHQLTFPQPSELARPTFKDTALYRVPRWAYSHITSRFLNKTTHFAEEGEEKAEDEEDDNAGVNTPSSSSGADDFEVLDKVKTTAPNGTGKVVRRNKKSGRSGR